MTSRKKHLIHKLKLKEHPEGGFYREVYRSELSIPIHKLDSVFEGPRPVCTGIYYLLGLGNFSAFHRIKSDEIWHHYEGEPITIHVIHKNGVYEALHLGTNIDRGESFQQLVPAGTWFAASLDADASASPDSYCLAGCTVSPGFDFEDFEMADGYMLKNAFPEHKEIIEKLVR